MLKRDFLPLSTSFANWYIKRLLFHSGIAYNILSKAREEGTEMAGIRMSMRLETVKASCGHETTAEIYPSTTGRGGEKSRANVARATSHPCYACKPKQECGCLVTDNFDNPGRHYCGKAN
jgi:hypothetical protein